MSYKNAGAPLYNPSLASPGSVVCRILQGEYSR